MLAARSAEYENLRGEEALRKADQIAKEHQHSLRKLLDELGSRNVLTGAEVSRKIEGYTGEQVIDILEKAYIESRYPVPSPIHRKFPIHRRSQYKIYHDLLGSTAPIKYSRKLAWTILKKIEQDFGIIAPQQKLATHISDAEWTRFCSLFFGLESA